MADSSKYRGSIFSYLFFIIIYLIFVVEGEKCPQQPEGKDEVNKRAQKLAGSGPFKITDKEKKYLYVIKLCDDGSGTTAILQSNLLKKGDYRDIAYYKGARVYGGSDWLIFEYKGDKYHHHCGKTARRAMVLIKCDRSADNKEKQKPIIIDEYRPKDTTNAFCYYLFEMNHNGVCPASKTKISPGSVFIIIVVIVGFLYLLLGFLFQRYIVGAKGMEQIPNYLMWREFGTLQADGCNFVCRVQGTKEPTRYKRVDEAIADDEDFKIDEDDDNDDTMLPM